MPPYPADPQRPSLAVRALVFAAACCCVAAVVLLVLGLWLGWSTVVLP